MPSFQAYMMATGGSCVQPAVGAVVAAKKPGKPWANVTAFVALGEVALAGSYVI